MIAVRPTELLELPPATAVAPYADWCLEHGEPVVMNDLFLVPDLLLAEWLANGVDLPVTMRVQRADGRSVSVFAVVDDQGFAIAPTDSKESS